jgi:uncharacterized protein (DUF1499 family)
MRCHSYRRTIRTAMPRSGAVRPWLLFVLGLVLFFGIAVAVILVLTVDDWQRDLSTNVAQTQLEHSDPSLRCVVLPDDPNAAAEKVRAIAAGLPGWSESNAVGDSADELRFERTTRWFRFVDDITVQLTATEAGTRISATSRSRVGKGDLGQNPRNLRELLGPLRAQSSLTEK